MYSIPPTALLPLPEPKPSYLPMVDGLLRAGFPSPADEFATRQLDLIELLIKHPLATFYWQVSGKSMQDAGIWHGDILVVDRAVRPAHKSIVVAEVDGEFTVKFLHKRGSEIKLLAANPLFEEITFQEGQQVVICGVVTSCIKRFK